MPYVGRVAAAISTYEAVVALATKARKRWTGRTEYVTTVDSSDDMYRTVLAAVLDGLPADRRRSIAMHTGHGDNSGMAVPDGPGYAPTQRDVTWAYDGSRNSELTIGRHKIAVSLTDEQYGSAGERTWSRRQVQFTSPSLAARDALHDWLTGLVRQVRAAKPPMRIASVWGHWEHRGDVPHRALDTVVLAAGQKEQLVADVARFLESEPVYARLGVPFHRGYLLHGPPGTGKTSVAKALAAHFGLGLFYVPLADMRGDADLLRLVTDVPARSILLLEDVDVNTAATERTDDTQRASLSALLNALDGVFTPHGLIKVLTTNNRSVIDDAVLRKGRVGLELELGLCTMEQLDGLWRLAYGHEPLETGEQALYAAVGRPAGDVVDVLLRHADDPAGARAELASWRVSQPVA